MAILRNGRGLLVFFGLTLNTVVWFIPIFILAIVKLVLPVPSLRRMITRALMWFGGNWVNLNCYILVGGGALQWQVSGTHELKRDGWYLIIVNHQTWVDIVVLQTIFRGRIPFLKFFIKQELIWLPFLGVAWWAMDMPFMKRYSKRYLMKHPEKKAKDLASTKKACEKFRDTPTSIINFIEGTRFSESKRDAQQSPYRYLLMPRAGGIAIALSSMGELFDAVLDVTLVYPNGIPSFWGMCCGDKVRLISDLRILPCDTKLIGGDYQNDRAYRHVVHLWMTDIWKNKDRRIDAMHSDSQSSARVA